MWKGKANAEFLQIPHFTEAMAAGLNPEREKAGLFAPAAPRGWDFGRGGGIELEGVWEDPEEDLSN